MGQMTYMRGSQPGMPALGTLGTGDLVRALDVALVNGGTSQSITGITRVGTTATANKTAHGLLDKQMILMAGAAQAAYNGYVRISRIDADNYSYQVVGAPATPATGVITAAIAPLGGATPWGIAFTAANQRSYRAPSGRRHYLMVNDNANTNTAIVRGFVAMTGVITGTGPFPTVTQSVTNLKWLRPDPTSWPTPPSSGSYDDSWVVIGDEKRFWLGITSQSTGYRFWHFFGEFPSFKAADAYNTAIMGAANSDGSDVVSPAQIPSWVVQQGSQAAGAYFSASVCALARGADQVTLSMIAGMHSAFYQASSVNSNFSGGPAAGTSSPISGGIDLSYADFVENTSGSLYFRRGRMPLIVPWSPPDFVNNDGAIYTGLTNFPDILLIRGGYFDANIGLMFPIGDWDTVLTP